MATSAGCWSMARTMHATCWDVAAPREPRRGAARVAAGGVAKLLLKDFGIQVRSYTRSVGAIECEAGAPIDWDAVESSPVRCPDATAGAAMVAAIDAARERGDTLGGVFTVVADGVPPGLGSYRQWGTRLDGLLAQAIVSIPACNAVSLGDGVESARRPGSEVHDSPAYDGGGLHHETNPAGGVTGGVSNSEPVGVP